MSGQQSYTGTENFISSADMFTETTQLIGPSLTSASTWPPSYPQNDQDISPHNAASIHPLATYPEALQFTGGFAENTEPTRHPDSELTNTELVNYLQDFDCTDAFAENIGAIDFPEAVQWIGGSADNTQPINNLQPDLTKINAVNFPERDVANTSPEDVTSKAFLDAFGSGPDPFGVDGQPNMLGDVHPYHNPQSQLPPSNISPFTDGVLPEQGFFNPTQQQEALPEFLTQEMLGALHYPATQPLPPDSLAAFSTPSATYYPETQDNPPVPVPAPSAVAPQAPSGAQRPPTNMNAEETREQVARATRQTYYCDRCTYSCGYSDEMRRHRDSVHDKIKRHHCHVCNVDLNDPSGLSKHKKSRKHRENAKKAGLRVERSFKWICPLCREHKKDAVYLRSDHLKRHFLRYCAYSNGALPEGFTNGDHGMDRGKIVVEESEDEAPQL